MFFFLLRPPNLLAAAVSEKFNNETDGLAAVQMLMDLIDNDYSIVHVSGVPKSHQRGSSEGFIRGVHQRGFCFPSSLQLLLHHAAP